MSKHIEAIPFNKEEIMHQYHLNLGHGSGPNMKFAIRQKYQWPNMFKDIDTYISKCKSCLKYGEARINTKNKIVESSRPNELWEVDIIGYLKETKNKNKYILVAIDHYTKWVEAKAIKAKDGETIAKAIEDLIIRKHGRPETIYSDNGLEFNNSHISRICEKFEIKWIFNSPGHHKAIGAVERVNQTLFNKLKKLCSYRDIGWDKHIEEAVYATNISFNRSINTSPYILTQGKHPDLKIDKKYGKTEIKKIKF